MHMHDSQHPGQVHMKPLTTNSNLLAQTTSSLANQLSNPTVPSTIIVVSGVFPITHGHPIVLQCMVSCPRRKGTI